jgi:hypothetical protein
MYKGQQGYRMIVGADFINLTWKLKNFHAFSKEMIEI